MHSCASEQSRGSFVKLSRMDVVVVQVESLESLELHFCLRHQSHLAEPIGFAWSASGGSRVKPVLWVYRQPDTRSGGFSVNSPH